MKRREGFTVLELLMAMVVLALMVVLMAGMVSNVSSAWVRSRAKIDNFAKGRALIDHLDGELRRAIPHGSLATFPSTGSRSSFAFHANSLVMTNESTASHARPLTYVAYEMAANGSLQRHDVPYSFDGDAPHWVGPNDASTTPAAGSLTYDLCEGVYGFLYAFLDRNGNAFESFGRGLQILPSERTTSVQVSLLIVSEQAEQLLARNPEYAKRVKDIAAIDPPDSRGTPYWSPKREWDERLGNADLTRGLPEEILTGIRTYERIVPFAFTPAQEAAP